MNKRLKETIFKYLDNTYEIDLDSLAEYTVILKTENKRISIATMYDDVKEFYLGATGKKSFRDVKHYRRRKRWL